MFNILFHYQLPVDVLLDIIARTNTRGIKYTISNEFDFLQDATRLKAEWHPCRISNKLDIEYFIPQVFVLAFIPHLLLEKCI